LDTPSLAKMWERAFDRLLGQVALGRDLPVGPPDADELGDLPLPFAECRQPSAARAG